MALNVACAHKLFGRHSDYLPPRMLWLERDIPRNLLAISDFVWSIAQRLALCVTRGSHVSLKLNESGVC